MRAKSSTAPFRRWGFILASALVSIRRGGVKNLIVPLTSFVLALFIGLFGHQIATSEDELDVLYENSEVLAYFTSGSGKHVDDLIIDPNTVNSIAETGFVGETYTTAIRNTHIIGAPTSIISIYDNGEYLSIPPGFAKETFFENARRHLSKVCFVSDIKHAPEFFFENALAIEYLDGYDASVFGRNESVCALSEGMMDALGYELGDSIRLAVFTSTLSDAIILYKDVTIVAQFTRVGSSHLIYMPAEQANKGYILNTDRQYSNASQSYYDGYEIVDGLVYDYEYVDPYFAYDAVSMRLTNLKDLAEFKEYLIDSGYSPIGNRGSARKWIVIEDTLLNDSVMSINRHISYMQILFIAVYALAIGIGFVLSSLLTKMRRRELALMRSMGAGRFKTFAAFFIEQALLCVTGCVMAVLVLRIWNGSLAPLQWYSFIGYIGCYWLGAAVSVMLMNKVNIIEILTAGE